MTEMKDQSEKIKESTIVRGVCESIQKMQLPLFIHMDELLKKFGYKLVKEKPEDKY